MDPTIKLRWLEALRSGKYEQGRGHLRYRDPLEPTYRYCCLGVLCDIVDPTKWEIHGTMYDGAETSLPCLLRDDLKITGGQESRLVTLNDGIAGSGEVPQSFLAIADWIEANL